MNIITTRTSPNYWNYNSGRRLIVLHGTAGGNSIDWLCSPAAGVSANYVITLAGEVYCLVDPFKGYSAWANGIPESPEMSNPQIAWAINNKVNLNTISVSIEHEAASANMIAHNPLPLVQLKASLELVTMLTERLGIPRDRGHIIGHYQIMKFSRANCPGVIDLDKYVDMLATSTTQGTSTPPAPPVTGGHGPNDPVFLNNFYIIDQMATIYRKLGDQALPLLGLPTSGLYLDDTGKPTQEFEKTTLQIFKENAGTPFEVQAKIITRTK